MNILLRCATQDSGYWRRRAVYGHFPLILNKTCVLRRKGMGSKTDDQTGVQIPTRHLIRLFIVYLCIPLLLFLCGWDAGWWQAWVFSLLFVAAGIGGRMWAERLHPGLLAERERAGFGSAADVKPLG